MRVGKDWGTRSEGGVIVGSESWERRGRERGEVRVKGEGEEGEGEVRVGREKCVREELEGERERGVKLEREKEVRGRRERED